MTRYTLRRMLFSFILVFFGVAVGGCSFILPLTEIQPLEEKLLGGAGKDKILLIDISGIITDKKKAVAFGFKERPGLVARVKEEIDKAEQDEAVRGIILRINSPGGTVTASDIIYHEIKGFKERTGRTVVVEMLDVATSGGYYIAAAADTIVAHPTTVTGSIGVVAYRLNAAGLIRKLGLMDETIKSGRYKDMGSPLRNMSKGERKILQGIVDSMYGRFLDAILEGRRGISSKKLKRIADGRIYSAKQALKLKLIDKIGYLEDAIVETKRLAGISEAKIIAYGRPSDYKSNIYSSESFNIPSAFNPFTMDIESLISRLGISFMYLWIP